MNTYKNRIYSVHQKKDIAKKNIKIGIIGLCLYCSFEAGKYSKIKEQNRQEYQLIQINNQQYLRTPIGNKRINESHQVGDLEYRLKGILDEKYSNLKKTIEEIKVQF